MEQEKLIETIDRLGKGYEALQAKLDEIDGAVKSVRGVDYVDRASLDAIATEVAELKAQKDAIERKLNAAQRGGGEVKGLAPEQAEQKQAFIRAIRRQSAFEDLKTKAVDADFANNSASGGVAVPEVIATQILRRVKELSPMRSLIRVTPVSSPNYERLVDVLGTASGWSSESGTRSETDTPQLQRVTFTHGELYALPKTSNWALNDLMFDVEAWLTESVAEEFAYQEGLAFISGNGTNKPTGMLNGTPSPVADNGARPFGVLQYVPTGVAGSFGTLSLTSPVFYPTDVFETLIYSLKARYRSNARFLMNKSTLSTVMKMRDGDGRSMWQPSFVLGQPDTIRGYPVTEMEAMPSIGANTFPIAFGDFFAGYEAIDVVGMSMIRDEITTKGHTLFYISKRLGGKIVQDEAIKLIKMAAS